MEAKELMIGDYVHHNLGYTLKVYDNLDKEGFDFDEYESRALLENVEPIPLTEEILKANGFDLVDKDDIYTLRYTNGEVDITIHNMGKLYVIHYGAYSIPSHYVHQLQHALRLCGLDDLADNFKIAD